MRFNPLSSGKRKILHSYLTEHLGDEPYFHADSFIDVIEESDPTPNGTYTLWIAKVMASGEVFLNPDFDPELGDETDDREDIHQYLEQFHRIKPQLVAELRNINDYQTFHQLTVTVDAHLGVKSKRQARRDAVIQGQQVMAEMPPYKLIQATNKEAAATLAKNTKWCVHHESAAANYLALGPLYFVNKEEKPYALFHYEKNELKALRNRSASDSFREELRPILELFEAGAAVEVKRSIFMKDPSQINLQNFLQQLSLTGRNLDGNDPLLMILGQQEWFQSHLQVYCLQQGIFSYSKFPLEIAEYLGEARKIEFFNTYIYPIKWGNTKLEWARTGFWTGLVQLDDENLPYLVFIGKYKFTSPRQTLLAVRGRSDEGYTVIDLMISYLDTQNRYLHYLDECRPHTVVDYDTYDVWPDINDCTLGKLIKGMTKAVDLEKESWQIETNLLPRIDHLKKIMPKWEGEAVMLNHNTVEYTLRWPLDINTWLGLILFRMPWQADYSREVVRAKMPDPDDIRWRLPSKGWIPEGYQEYDED